MKIVLKQRLEEVAATVDLDLAVFLCFQLRDRLRDITLDQESVVPVQPFERPRSNVLRAGVEGRGDLVRWVGGLRPRACEDLIGPAAQEEGAGASGPPGHDLA